MAAAASEAYSKLSNEAAYYSLIPPYISEPILKFYQAEALAEAESKQKADGGLSYKALAKMQQASIDMANMTKVHVYSPKTAAASPISGLHSYHSLVLRDKSSPNSNREVWDVSGKTDVLMISDKGASPSLPSGDNDYRRCFSNMQSVDTFFKSAFEIYPVDGIHVMRVDANYQGPLNGGVLNAAFWDPTSERAYFTKFDSNFFTSYMRNLTCVSHEFGHSVTSYVGKLKYHGQSGALNESMSDVFAIMNKHYFSNELADGPDTSWLIGEGALVNNNGTALRSMKNPGTAFRGHPILWGDLQVDHMNNYIKMTANNGGVHYNSGIPNRAFYLAASRIGGLSYEVAGKIWFQALRSTVDDDFASFAHKTLQATTDLKLKAEVWSAVAKAWYDVGVLYKMPPTPKNTDSAASANGNNDASASGLSNLASVGLLSAGFLLGLLSGKR